MSSVISKAKNTALEHRFPAEQPGRGSGMSMPRGAHARHAAVVIRGTKVVLTCVKPNQTQDR